ncbi:MAG: ATP-binding cassette domain-containing protein [Deltaproteobacteria bacterium]|nr:ATP-binding cassette domain-containing protein [Deltaproteobacteria bacterium]
MSDAPASPPMIQIEGLTKHYGRTHALRGITFEVPKGQVVGFLGPNGAGKSTTMKILTGFVEATGGIVKVAGISVADDPVGARTRIGYLPENNPLYEDMMVEEYLEYIARIRRIPADKVRGAIDTAVARCGLQKVRGKDIGELSKGFRQRVGLAQAIVHDPDLLILDEPTTGLDPNQVVEIRNLIRELGKEKTVILSTHVLPEVQHMCGRALIISEGKIVADGAPDQLSSDGGHIDLVVTGKRGAPDLAATRALLKALPDVAEVHERTTGEKDALAFSLTTKGSADPRRALFAALVDAELVLLSLDKKALGLEETFRKLTTAEAGKAEHADHPHSKAA